MYKRAAAPLYDAINQSHLSTIVRGRLLLHHLVHLLHLNFLAIFLLELTGRTDGIVNVKPCALGRPIAIIRIQIGWVELNDARCLTVGNSVTHCLFVILNVDGIVQLVHLTGITLRNINIRTKTRALLEFEHLLVYQSHLNVEFGALLRD